MRYQQPKGTFDILPQVPNEEDAWRLSERWQYVEGVIRDLVHAYNYREIRTPIFEMTEVFTSAVGEGSDIVSKEMYTFEDKGKRSLTLRPEGTAPIARAFVENHLVGFGQHHKLYYIGPYFRYDRPQAGRFRQFHQFGVEAIGQKAPEQDVEVIDMMCELYRRLHIPNYTIFLNSLGGEECRVRFLEKLKAFLEPRKEALSEDSRNRLIKNPLRILDSKDPNDRAVLQGAPSIQECLSEEAEAHFTSVRRGLDILKIPYQVAPGLVRGLDYYNHSVFEATSSVLGAQNAIGAGGRYDGLLRRFGGPTLPGVGFAIGLERLLSTMQGVKAPFPPSPHPFIYIIPLGERARELCLSLVCRLRHSGIPAEIFYQPPKLQKRLQEVDKRGTPYCLILGDEEIASGRAALKEMQQRTDETISLTNIEVEIKTLWQRTNARTI